MALCSTCIASEKTTDRVKISPEQLREEKEARQREAQKAKETEEAEERRRQAKKELERQRAEEARREEEERRKRQEGRKSRRKLKIELKNEFSTITVLKEVKGQEMMRIRKHVNLTVQ